MLLLKPRHYSNARIPNICHHDEAAASKPESNLQLTVGGARLNGLIIHAITQASCRDRNVLLSFSDGAIQPVPIPTMTSITMLVNEIQSGNERFSQCQVSYL